MLRVMVRAILVVAVGAVLASIAAAGPRPGRVVRIERRARSTTFVPRWCDVSADDENGICRGPRPNIGDTITIIAPPGLVAELRVSEVTETNCPLLWKIRSRVLRGDFSATPAWIAVIDPGLDARSHLLVAEKVASPTGRRTDEVQFAIDRDGDGREDVVGIDYVCDDAGTPDPNAGGDCYDVYSRSGADVTKAHSTILPSCSATP
jgi:hypothetical protein